LSSIDVDKKQHTDFGDSSVPALLMANRVKSHFFERKGRPYRQGRTIEDILLLPHGRFAEAQKK
jgi:hypothetical protein